MRKSVKPVIALLVALALGACSADVDDAGLSSRVTELRASGDYDTAIALVSAAIDKRPDDPALQHLLGILYLDTENWPLAEILLRKAMELGRTDNEIQLQMSRVLFMQNKFDDALAVLADMRYASNREQLEGDIRSAKALERIREYSLAKRAFLRIIKSLDRNELVHDDPIDSRAVFSDLESERGTYRSLNELLEQRERLHELPIGEWVSLHKQRVSQAVFFTRQDHGGSAFDTKRAQLILFGSDTHGYGDILGENWKNNAFFFDPALGEWERTYARDRIDTYTVNADGIPVAGENGNHPWAMHTYGAVSYDARRDQLIVSSHPAHLEPGRFTYILQKIWPKVRRHPTWTLQLETRQWEPLDTEPQSFFHYATAYDSDRGVILGYRDDGIWELSGTPRNWKKVLDRGLLGPDNNIVYDSEHRAFVVFGSKGNSNDVAVYEPTTDRHEIMPTPGDRPPPDRHVPMAFHAGVGKSVMLVQRVDSDDPAAGITETWLYDLGADAWERVENASINFLIGRNYNLEYDPINDLLLFVPNPYGTPSLTEVLALRLAQARSGD